jgi:hypothetical protein
MVIHWYRERGRGWRVKALFNGIGAVTTAITLVIVTISKFMDGAWIVAVLVIILILIFRSIERHYHEIGPQLSVRGLTPASGLPPSPRVVLPVSSVHQGVVKALAFACSISNRVTAVYIEIDPEQTARVRQEWEVWGQGVLLEVISSPYRSVIAVLLDFLERTDQEHANEPPAVLVLPEFIPARWWQNLLHNQTAWAIKLATLYQRKRFGSGRVIVDVPFHLH